MVAGSICAELCARPATFLFFVPYAPDGYRLKLMLLWITYVFLSLKCCYQ